MVELHQTGTQVRHFVIVGVAARVDRDRRVLFCARIRCRVDEVVRRAFIVGHAAVRFRREIGIEIVRDHVSSARRHRAVGERDQRRGSLGVARPEERGLTRAAGDGMHACQEEERMAARMRHAAVLTVMLDDDTGLRQKRCVNARVGVRLVVDARHRIRHDPLDDHDRAGSHAAHRTADKRQLERAARMIARKTAYRQRLAGYSRSRRVHQVPGDVDLTRLRTGKVKPARSGYAVARRTRR